MAIHPVSKTSSQLESGWQLTEPSFRAAPRTRFDIRAAWFFARVLLVLLTATAWLTGAVIDPARQPDLPTEPSDNSPQQSSSPESSKAPRTDLYGDPLPEGAIARLGSLRFYHGQHMYVDRVFLSPDGTRIISMTQQGDRKMWEARTGKELSLRDEVKRAAAFSATEDKLLALMPEKGDIVLWDVMAESQVVRVPMEIAPNEPIGPIGLCPKGKTLVCFFPKSARNDSRNKLRFADAQKRTLLNSVDWNEDKLVSGLIFSADGSGLVTSYSDDSLDIWNLKTGTVRMKLNLKINRPGHLALSPDCGRLAAHVYSEKQIRFWDIQKQKELEPLSIDPEIAAVSVTFSHDGKYLAATSQMAVVIWDVNSRKQVRQLSGKENPWAPVFSQDGKLLLAGDGCGISQWEVSTGRLIPDLGHRYTVDALAFSPDGRTIASGAAYSDPVVRTWDPFTGKPKAQLHGHTVGIEAVAYSPDGKLLASGSQDESVRLWDLSTGKEVGCLEAHDGMIYGMDFSPDGKTIATGGKRKAVHLWDIATRKEIRSFDNPGAFALRVAFSPDGRIIACRGNRDDVVRIWEVSTGELLRSIPGLPGGCPNVSFAPDSRTLAINCDDGMVRLWDVVSGKQIKAMGTPSKPGQFNRCLGVVFAPDGRSLATGYDDGSTRVWEVASGRERIMFRGHWGAPLGLAYSPDGVLLASGSSDHTAIIWDVMGHTDATRQPRVQLDRKSLNDLWADLASADASKAFRAIQLLVTSSQQSVPFLNDQIQPATAGNQKRIAQLIADLDNESFEVRENGSRALMQIGEYAESSLRTALAGKPSAEVRRRAEAIVAELDPAKSPARLRQLRAIEVLEYIGTPEAKKLLEKLAAGAPEARLTQETKASIDRLTKRGRPTP